LLNPFTSYWYAILANDFGLNVEHPFVKYRLSKLGNLDTTIVYSLFSKQRLEYCLFLFLILPLICLSFFFLVIDTVSNNLSYAQTSNDNSTEQQIILPTKPFSRQEIKDESSEWYDLNTGSRAQGLNETDIKSVTYYSDGRFLYATLWLSSFDKNPTSDIYYGMLVDADFNNSTGNQGIDYKSEIYWNNTEKIWTRVFNEMSSVPGKEKVWERQKNYTIDPGAESGGFVNLYTDLKKMLSPSKFKIFFYAYSAESNDSPFILDPVRWAYIPPPEFVLTVSPDVIELPPGEKTAVEVRLNSITELNPTVTFSSSNFPERIKSDFKYREREIPPLGMATSPMTITAENADPGPNTAFINGNLDFPVQWFKSPFNTTVGGKIGNIPIQSQDVNTTAGFTLLIKEPPNLQESMQSFLDLWFNPLTSAYATISTIINGILGWKIWRQSKQGTVSSGGTSSAVSSGGRPIHK
jgi:hypothetical protein